MNRLFGTTKARGPAPNMTDSIANLDGRGDSVEKKIQKLDVSKALPETFTVIVYSNSS